MCLRTGKLRSSEGKQMLANRRALLSSSYVLSLAALLITTEVSAAPPAGIRMPINQLATLANDANAASGGWEVTVYYTAVESYHVGPPQAVHGCVGLNCANGNTLLGTYPRDFVDAVAEEGTGRITSGSHAGQYLNWSNDTGYWLDSAPRDARGIPLQAFVSAAADPSIAYLTSFTVVDCGADAGTGDPISAATCLHLRTPVWSVRDRFTAGAVGKHVDLYIGEEDQANFATASPRVIDVAGATINMLSLPALPAPPAPLPPARTVSSATSPSAIPAPIVPPRSPTTTSMPASTSPRPNPVPTGRS